MMNYDEFMYQDVAEASKKHPMPRDSPVRSTPGGDIANLPTFPGMAWRNSWINDDQ